MSTPVRHLAFPTADAPVAPPEGLQEQNRQRLTTLLVALVFAWVVLPRLIQSVLSPKFRGRVGESAPATNAVANLADFGLALAVLLFCLFILITVFRDEHDVRFGALVVMVLPWTYLVARDLFAGQFPALFTLLLPVVMFTLWILKPGIETLGVIGYLAGAAAVLCVVMGLVLPSKGLFVSSGGTLVSEGKEIIPGGILVGFFSHGNSLGLFLALSVPLVCTIKRRAHRYPLLVITLFALVWSASRSSIVAVAVAALGALAIACVPRAMRHVMAVAVAAVPFVAACLLPFLPHDPVAFNNRGLIWEQSLLWWRDNEWFGLGSNWYGVVGQTSSRISATAFSGHNQFIQFLVMGGVVLVLLVAVQVVFLLIRVSRLARAGTTVTAAYLATLATTCFLEKPYLVVDSNGALFGVVALPLAVIAFCATSEDASRPDVVEQREPEPHDSLHSTVR